MPQVNFDPYLTPYTKINSTTVKTDETQSWFFEKINNINKPLARLVQKKKRHKLSVSRMREVASLQILQISKG